MPNELNDVAQAQARLSDTADQRFNGDILLAVAEALDIWGAVAPSQGTYHHTCLAMAKALKDRAGYKATRPNQEDLAENKAGIPVKNASYWRRDSEAKEAELVEAVELLKKVLGQLCKGAVLYSIEELKSFLSKRQGGS